MNVVRTRAKTRRGSRHAGRSRQFNVRLAPDADRALAVFAARHGVSRSAAALRFIEEGLRMSRFPGVDFRWTPTGRQPHVTGTGLTVWEIVQIWTDHKENRGRVIENYPHLARIPIEGAVAYARAYRSERPPDVPLPPSVREVRV